MGLAKGDTVRIIRCEQCGQLVGKVITVKSVSDIGTCQLSFGRGRPNKNRPEFFAEDDLEKQEVAEESNA